MIQGTPEWHQARLGRVTGSRIADVMMAKSTAGYQNYRAQLICERLTGILGTVCWQALRPKPRQSIETSDRAMRRMSCGTAGSGLRSTAMHGKSRAQRGHE